MRMMLEDPPYNIDSAAEALLYLEHPFDGV
jgi:hypothetical protein